MCVRQMDETRIAEYVLYRGRCALPRVEENPAIIITIIAIVIVFVTTDSMQRLVETVILRQKAKKNLVMHTKYKLYKYKVCMQAARVTYERWTPAVVQDMCRVGSVGPSRHLCRGIQSICFARTTQTQQFTNFQITFCTKHKKALDDERKKQKTKTCT